MISLQASAAASARMRHRGARVIVIVVALLAALMMPARAADETLELAVTINGYPIGKIGEFVRRDSSLLARPSELADLGLKLPQSIAPGPDGLVELSAITGLQWRFDQSTQAIYMNVGFDLLSPAMLRVAPAPGSAAPVESGLGATLNYDLAGNSVSGQTVGSGLFDLRAFSPWGVASTNLLAYAGAAPTGAGGNSEVRLDSSYVYSDSSALRRYHFGDFINGGLGWTRPVRLGGVQLQSDFSMRPDLVTFPLPSVGGTVAVPSTVDVLVNGSRLLSRQVAPGPFEVPQLPVVNGAGTVTTTVVNALGRQVTTTLPFYASSELLAPGLQSYSAELGSVRRNWGFISNDYGALAGSGTYRRGLSSKVTGEVHAEGTAGQFMAGIGAAANVFDLGVLNLSTAASTGSGRTGRQLSVGAQRIGQVFSFGTSATFADKNFLDIAAMNGDPMPQRQINANAGVSTHGFGSFGVAYTGIDRAAIPAPINLAGPGGFFVSGVSASSGASAVQNVVSFLPAQHAHVFSASYSVQIKQVSFYATGFHDLANPSNSGFLLGITIPLGSRSSASVSTGMEANGNNTQLQAVQSPVSVGDWGYQAYAAHGNPDHEFAEVQYKSPWALVSAGADRIDRETTLRTEAQGALSVLGGGVFPSNAINDSFAVVDTNGTRGVRVFDENREVGRTGSAGQVLVPDLRSFDVNHLAIDPADVPITDRLPYTTRDVRPQDRSGVVVRFPIQDSHSALLRLVDATGKPLPVGSAATLAGTGVAVPVGYDGEAYIENLRASGNRLSVVGPDGQPCEVLFDYHPKPGEIPKIGPLQCRQEK